MIVRAMHIHQRLADFSQDIERGGRAIDELPAAPAHRHRAPQNELILRTRLESIFVQKILERTSQLFDIENSFNGTRVGTAANQSFISTFTEKKIEGSNKNRFARSSFPGNGIV